MWEKKTFLSSHVCNYFVIFMMKIHMWTLQTRVFSNFSLFLTKVFLWWWWRKEKNLWHRAWKCSDVDDRQEERDLHDENDRHLIVLSRRKTARDADVVGNRAKTSWRWWCFHTISRLYLAKSEFKEIIIIRENRQCLAPSSLLVFVYCSSFSSFAFDDFLLRIATIENISTNWRSVVVDLPDCTKLIVLLSCGTLLVTFWWACEWYAVKLFNSLFD